MGIVKLTRSLLPILLLVICASCAKPPSYAPPAQVILPSGPEPASGAAASERLVIAMSDTDVNSHVVSDVFTGLDRAEFRFTGLHPQFQIQVANPKNLDLYVRLFNHDEALRDRGPVHVTATLNGKSFPLPPFDARGDQEFRLPLPDGWLDKPGPVEISLDIDPPWHHPDGNTYGILLNAIGFVRRGAVSSAAGPPPASPPQRPAILAVASILFAAAFTFFVSLALGKTVIHRLKLKLYRSEEIFLGFVLGAACLSLLVFCLSIAHLAYTWVFFVAGLSILAIAWKFGGLQLTADRLPPLPRAWKRLFFAIYSIYAALYLVAALCPESSVDGTAYHIALPAQYLREHHIPAITTNLLSTLSEGAEMLFLFAFSFGKHSAASMVHLLFTLAVPLGILSYGKRIGSPVAGAVAGLLFFLSPATAVVGTAAYVDVASAAAVFAVFYLIQIWRVQQNDRLLILAGIVAGFAFAIKYTAVLAGVYAVGAVVARRWRSGKPVLRPCAAVAVGAFFLMSPWLIKNAVVTGNPVAPLGNRFFPNPNLSPAIEHAYIEETGSLGGLPAWQWPYDVTARGSHTQGFLGPVFLLTPLALLALRVSPGRQLLAAAALFLVPYAAAAPARYLLPALTMLSLALGLVFVRWRFVAPAIVGLHAILSWPTVIPHYAAIFGPPGPRLEMPSLRAALRITPEPDYLEEHLYGEERVNGYGIGLFMDANMRPHERAFAFRAFQQAYHARDVIVDWESETGVRMGSSIRAAIDPLYQPSEQHRFSFAPRSVRKIRLVQTGRSDTDQWSVNELRFSNGGMSVDRAPQWRIQASPNPWDAPLAFDNSPLTRWASREPARPGMYVEIDFGGAQSIDLVTADGTPGQSGIKMDIEFETSPGDWRSAGARHDIAQVEMPPRLRRAAMENLLRQNVEWLVINDMDPGARDFDMNQAQWGIKQSGASSRYRLYHIEPASELPSNSQVPAVSKLDPVKLEGFYDLEQGRYRWTQKKFAVTFDKFDRPGAARLIVSMYVPETSIARLGPMKLAARIGEHVLTPATFRQPGEFVFEREIPTEWLRAGPNRFEFALDKAVAPTATESRELGIVVNKVELR